MASGIHGENRMDPEKTLSLLQTYMHPVLAYGLEVNVPSKKVLSILETQYRKITKQILSIPSNTADSAIYMLSGTIPLEGVIHKKIAFIIWQHYKTCIQLRGKKISYYTTGF